MKRQTKYILFSSILLMSLVGTKAVTQEVEFARQRGPYYVGEPVLVQILASGYKKSDKVECKYNGDPIEGVTVSGPQVGQSSSSFVQIINGKVTRRESITYRFSFRINSDREGEFDISPFEFIVNGDSKTVRGEKFKFGKLEADENMEIEISLPKDTIYIGEKVPVTIRWAFSGSDAEVQFAYRNLQIRSPLFDQFPFVDKDIQSRRQTTLTLATTKGGVEIAGEVSKETKDGDDIIVVTGQRIMVADAAGRYDSIPITCRTKKVTRWGRDLFGDRVAQRAVPSLATGKGLSFEVKPVPLDGQPKSFAGAVGRGFSLQVAANRSVVRVGDPISLTVSLSGDGNLEAVSLPEIGEQMGLGSDDFQIPTEKLSGTIDGNTKQFNVNVRVKNQNISQIPALSFSWFDPVEEKFVSADSKPIALQVMETKIVSSADVVSMPGATGGAEAEKPDSPKPNVLASLSGANLAIETDPQRLVNSGKSGNAMRYLPFAIYGGAILFALTTMLLGRRSEVSIQTSKRKTQLALLKKKIQTAGSQSGKGSFSSIADSLREFVREFEPGSRSQIERLIAECDNAIYSPSESSDHEIVKRIAQESIHEIEKEAQS